MLLAQAADDRGIRRAENRRAVRDLRQLGAEVRFLELPEGSHGLTEYPVLSWAFEWFSSMAGREPTPEGGPPALSEKPR